MRAHVHVLCCVSSHLFASILQDSGDICKQLGLCNSTLSMPHKVNVQQVYSLKYRMPAACVYSMKRVCIIIYNSFLSVCLLQSKQVKDQVCDVCTLAANFLMRLVDGNGTEAEAKAALEGVCNLLPDSAKTEVCS